MGVYLRRDICEQAEQLMETGRKHTAKSLLTGFLTHFIQNKQKDKASKREGGKKNIGKTLFHVPIVFFSAPCFKLT